MQKPDQTGRGSTLIAALIFIAIISTATGLAFVATTQLGKNAQRTRQFEGAIAAGDAHLEWAFAQWRSICRSQGNVAPSTSSFGAITKPNSAWVPQPVGYTASNYGITAVDVQGNPLASGAPPAAQGQSSLNNSFFYKASVDVSVPTTGRKPVTAKVRRIFEKHIESPWEYAIFYNDDLEFHPSPLFQVTGWVFTNGSLYVSPDGGNPLVFNERVSYATGYLEGYKDGDWQGRGYANANGKAPGNTFAPGLPPANENRKDFAGIVPTQFKNGDGNTNNDGYRELIERPDSAFPDPLTDSSGNNPRLYNAAGVKVLVDGANNITVMNASGKVMSPSGTAAEKAFYNEVVGAVTTNQTIQDFREASSVRLVSVDIGKVNPTKIAGWNGVVYVSDTSASQTGVGAKRGVRLKNGATLPQGGLTVVSDNPVYIQGDYNTLGTRQAAAVMGDAIMVMSNSWKDANSSADISSGLRKASDTTINTALLGGIVTTDPSLPDRRSYSGGVENFPRFMEDWSGKNLNYNGSMVELFESKQAIGRWGTSSQSYNPPARNWAYETLFRTTPPPGTLFTTTYNKQRWYLE